LLNTKKRRQRRRCTIEIAEEVRPRLARESAQSRRHSQLGQPSRPSTNMAMLMPTNPQTTRPVPASDMVGHMMPWSKASMPAADGIASTVPMVTNKGLQAGRQDTGQLSLELRQGTTRRRPAPLDGMLSSRDPSVPAQRVWLQVPRALATTSVLCDTRCLDMPRVRGSRMRKEGRERERDGSDWWGGTC